MAAKKRRYKKLFNTSEHSPKPPKNLIFFLDRSLGIGKKVVEMLRAAGLKVETHGTWFRHDTPDEDWLKVVGALGWVVLKRDKAIAENVIELDALLDANVKSFVMKSGSLTDVENAGIFLDALPKILEMIDANNFPFVAKVYKDGSVKLWKDKPNFQKGIQKKKRLEHEQEAIAKAVKRISKLREAS